jgi:hypothetical protein
MGSGHGDRNQATMPADRVMEPLASIGSGHWGRNQLSGSKGIGTSYRMSQCGPATWAGTRM